MKSLYLLAACWCMLLVQLYATAPSHAVPRQTLIQSYAKDFSLVIEADEPYQLLHQTPVRYYVAIATQPGLVVRLTKSGLPEHSVSQDTLTLRHAFYLEGDQSYIIFKANQSYEIASESDSTLKLKYSVGSHQLLCKVAKDDFSIVTTELELQASKDAICILEFSDQGAGSGFLLKTEGQLYCYSNQHIVANPGQLSIKLITGRELKTGTVEFAVDRDLARIQILEQLPAFSTVREARLGESIQVLGNSYGAGRVTKLNGKITGINERQIETDAKFVPGNSGSPILSHSQKVLGVATLIEMRSAEDLFSKGSVFEGGRRVGVRIDDTIEWIPVEMSLFQSRNRLLIQADSFIRELPSVYQAFTQTAPELRVPTVQLSDRSLKQWLEYRNSLYAKSLKEYKQQDKAAESLQRVDRILAQRENNEAYQASLIDNATLCWNSLRQKLQSKKRMLKSATPYPDTAYMKESIERMLFIVDAGLQATQVAQETLEALN